LQFAIQGLPAVENPPLRDGNITCLMLPDKKGWHEPEALAGTK